MPDVLVSEDIPGPAMDALRAALDVAFEPELWKSPQRLGERIADARALVVRNQTQVTGGLISRAARLQIIGRAGVGLDNVDVAAASAAGIVVSITPSQNSITVAELTLGLMLALARRIPAADRHVKGGSWKRLAFTGVELFGKTLGIAGFGRIGFATAMRARALGMDVIAHDPYIDPDTLTVTETHTSLVGLDELLARSDFLVCHLPGGERTRGLFDYARFLSMKPTAYFINVARGEVVDEPGLARALEEGRIAGAALDVRSSEPPEPGPFDHLDNVILTPHVGGFTEEAQRRVVAAVCRDVEAVLRGGAAAGFVNFPTPRRPGA
jgi:D-3-phosphoglycerate dehydrogenase